MTHFVPSYSTEQLLPPWVSAGSRNWAFFVHIDPGCIQRYLDTWFNAPGPESAPYYWRAKASSGYGVLLVCDHPDFSSERDGQSGWNTLSHMEAFWFFPADRYARGPDNLLEGNPQTVWIQPFALDNNSYVMFSSREIWGCEKDLAYIGAHQGKWPDDLHIDFAMEGCTTFSPKSLSHRIGVMHVAMIPSATPFDWKPVLDDRHLAALLDDFLAGIMAPIKAADSNCPFGHNSIEINTLKQFRNAFDMTFAAYRAVVSSRVTHSNIREPRFFSGKEVSIDFMWSASFEQRFTQLFGLKKPPADWPHRGHPEGSVNLSPPGIDWDMPRVRANVAFAASFTADSRFEVQDTLYTYGRGSGDRA